METWLAEIEQWGIDLNRLSCFLLPASLKTPTASGLFVLFRFPNDAEKLELMAPYGRIGQKLFLPTDAELFPQTTPAELDRLLNWEVQIFHPSIGLVGLSQKDQLSFADVIRFGSPQPTSWSMAKVGIPPKVRLTHIELEAQDQDTWMESLQQEMRKRPLDEIPPDPKEEGESLFGSLGRLGLGGLISATDALRDLFQSDETDGKGSSEPGALDRLSQWAKGKMDDLQARRNQQLNRLLNLFERNIDEALKYAIPLDSPYLNRGTAPPSDRLGRRNTNFNLGNLGGGGRADYWDIGSFYPNLRRKYQEAARKAIQAGDFRKAAYIYAHLLGDFRSAANVLRQGKYYREAAALYRDHLKDKRAAVRCLEEGGLLLEAIEIYLELKQHEKAGDLYLQLDQAEQAEKQYRICVQIELEKEKYLEACRLLLSKLDAEEEARAILLKGWQSSPQADLCLRKYADLIARDQEENLHEHIEQIFQEQTIGQRRELFLKTLVHINNKHRDEALLETSRQISYEVISEQIHEGKLGMLHSLREFLPGDRLIGSDTSRYKHLFRNRPPSKRPGPDNREYEPYLFLELSYPEMSIWTQAISCGEMLFATGLKTGKAIVVRANVEGHMEYNSWDISGPISHAKLFSEHPISDHLFFLSSETIISPPIYIPSK